MRVGKELIFFLFPGCRLTSSTLLMLSSFPHTNFYSYVSISPAYDRSILVFFLYSQGFHSIPVDYCSGKLVNRDE